MDKFDQLAARLAAIDGLRFAAACRWLHIPPSALAARAALALFPDSEEAAQEALDVICAAEVPFCPIGNGSNLLCADAGFAGAVLFTGKLRKDRFF